MSTDEKTLREALERIHRVASGVSDEAYMSIPADPKRDADLLLSAAIDELVALRERVKELEAEASGSDRLIGRQGSLLTAAVNVLRGAPPEDTLWSHHDVADLARQWVDRTHLSEFETASWKARAELKTIQRDRLREELTKARESLKELRRAHEDALAERDVLRERVEELGHELSGIDAGLKVLNETLDAAGARDATHQAPHSAVVRLIRERDEVVAEVERLRARVEELEGENADLVGAVNRG